MLINRQIVAKVIYSRVEAVELVERRAEVLILLEELEAGVTGDNRLVSNTALLDRVCALGAAGTSRNVSYVHSTNAHSRLPGVAELTCSPG